MGSSEPVVAAYLYNDHVAVLLHDLERTYPDTPGEPLQIMWPGGYGCFSGLACSSVVQWVRHASPARAYRAHLPHPRLCTPW